MDNLKERRLELGLTQRTLAKRASCTGSYISELERGNAVAAEEMRLRLDAILDGRSVERKERTAEEEELHDLWCRKYGLRVQHRGISYAVR